MKCKLCLGQKRLSTAANTTSNLTKHMRRQHASMTLVAGKDRTESDAEEKMLPSPTPTKQARLDFEQKLATKAEKERLVATYIVEEMLSVSVVELHLIETYW